MAMCIRQRAFDTFDRYEPSILYDFSRLISTRKTFVLENERLNLPAVKIIIIGRRVSRQVESGTRVKKMYRTIISASLESGVLYPVVLSIYAISSTSESTTDLEKYYTSQLVAYPSWLALLPVMGIGSTLIIVRTAMGIAIDDEKTFRETIMRDQFETQLSVSNEQDANVQGAGVIFNHPEKGQVQRTVHSELL
ncbi:hypothetical protein L218DRAFT_1007301 [Marasmius fiardii PR-910]|nr:hypothetical protein L218DRAFT_1007301 [Marasmius fiardii PR-910]